MNLEQILTIVSTIASFLFVTLIPSVILLIKKWKAYKNAKTNEEQQKILNEISDASIKFIQDAEDAFKSVDVVLKSKGEAGCGAMKKENVMTKIQSLCMQKGIEFDSQYWDSRVEELVTMTKKVNAKNN